MPTELGVMSINASDSSLEFKSTSGDVKAAVVIDTSVNDNILELTEKGLYVKKPTAADLNITGVMRFIGIITDDVLPDSGTNGDVVLFEGEEYVWVDGSWHELGDATSHALKTITITGIDGLAGGGNLEANREIKLSDATKESLAKADSAVQPEDLKDYYFKATNEDGNVIVSFGVRTKEENQ